jgi:hypothetical protein
MLSLMRRCYSILKKAVELRVITTVLSKINTRIDTIYRPKFCIKWVHEMHRAEVEHRLCREQLSLNYTYTHINEELYMGE